MRQLAQLAKSADKLAAQDAQVVVVFRENKDGAEGMKKAEKFGHKNFTLLDDPGGKATTSYSTEGFSTYIIDAKGEVQAELMGNLKERPLSEAVLEQLEKQ